MARKKQVEPRNVILGELAEVALGRRGFDCDGEVSLNERVKAFELMEKFKKTDGGEEKKKVIIIDDIG